jgi:integrase
MDAEAWLANERSLIDRDKWTPPPQRKIAEARKKREASYNTVKTFAERYLRERGLRPTTVHNYQGLLATRINPYFAEMPLKNVTLSEIKAWRTSLNPKAEATNAAAYRLLRSLLRAAEEEELIDRAPPKIRGAGSAPVRRIAVPATLEEIAAITDTMPERLRRSDVDGVTGRIKVSRKVDKDVVAGAGGACPQCGRVISAPKTASGVRTVHAPPPFLPMLQKHLLEHAAVGPSGLLFPGDRTDHMSVRYLMDRYRPARKAAGRPDLTIHHLRHTALTLAGQHGATAAELQARAGHASQAAMAIYQHATLDRDKRLADAIADTHTRWAGTQDRS